MASLIAAMASSRRDDARQVEEAGLHDGVDAPTHAGLFGHLVGVDGVHLELEVDDALLRLLGQPVPDLLGREGSVDKERAARHRRGERLVPLDEGPHVAGDEVGLVDQVGGTDGPRSEAQVADRLHPGLLGVVHEVALHVVGRVLADDLDGVLVRPHRAVTAQTVEQSPVYALRLGVEVWVVVQAGVGDIVVDAHGEVVLGLRLRQLVEHGLDHRRGELLAGQPVAPADDLQLHSPVSARALITSRYSGSPADPGSLVRSSTARLLTVLGRASTKCSTLKGRYSRTFSTPTFSPLAVR